MIAGLAVGLSSARTAAAETVDCAALVDEAIQSRAAGKLVQAQKQFGRCAEACPALHEDCATSALSALEATPTLLIEARDGHGNDITDVLVTIDDAVVANELDGRAFAVDPGKHTVVISRGGTTVTSNVLATAGEKAQPVRLEFRGNVDPDAPVRDTGGHTVWPWAVFAVGGAVAAAGIAVVVTTPALPGGCDRDTRSCLRAPKETQQAFSQRQEQAGSSVDQPKVGVLAIASGAILMGGALAWHFLETPEPRTARTRPPPRFTPWFGREGGGVAVRGLF